MSLAILYRDERYVAIHKPANVLVHRTWLASRDERFVLQALRDQLGQRVYPVHRLDRATDGVLLFGLDPEAAGALAEPFENQQVEKVYWAIVRGWTDQSGTIDNPVKDRDEGGEPKPGISHYRRLAQVELPVAVDRYPTSRYSWVEVRPLTGRRHQIRQHLKHIGHPLIGDTSYGKGPHNRFFRERFGIHRLLLMARSLAFTQPFTGEPLTITAEPEPTWRGLCEELGWTLPGSE
jgi:tRNA pseudouridine65 synthase